LHWCIHLNYKQLPCDINWDKQALKHESISLEFIR